MALWVCSRCGWTYDPATGDPLTPIPPGIAFEDLPEDWHCPNCGADRDYFFP
ncbi:MAG: rubredoxin [Magnetospirillum sp.]|nr:rubredoxin [Magnetospirillum sp.]